MEQSTEVSSSANPIWQRLACASEYPAPVWEAALHGESRANVRGQVPAKDYEHTHSSNILKTVLRFTKKKLQAFALDSLIIELKHLL